MYVMELHTLQSHKKEKSVVVDIKQRRQLKKNHTNVFIYDVDKFITLSRTQFIHFLNTSPGRNKWSESCL